MLWDCTYDMHSFVNKYKHLSALFISSFLQFLRGIPCVFLYFVVPLCGCFRLSVRLLPMRYLVFDDMTQCTPAEVARLLPLVSAQRREQALRFSHTFGQFCCLKSYTMLLTLLREWATEHPTSHPTSPAFAEPPSFSYNHHGQPQLEAGPCFSISHCRHAIAVAVSDCPVGIDVESIRPLRPELVAKTMNTAEQTLIATSSQPDRTFTRLWTRKEALLKLRGTGIIADLHHTLEDCANVSFSTMDDPRQPYILTIALDTMPI